MHCGLYVAAILLIATTLTPGAIGSSSLAPINCSNGPSLTVASFGEYVWNCSSLPAGGGDVLRIVVPSPTANASGLLSVEVRLLTFQQIIVDLGNIREVAVDVNVTVVLCGAPAVTNGNTVSMLNFSDRPLMPVLQVINASGAVWSNSSVGGVRVVVTVDSGVRVWLRNVSSLVSVNAFPESALWGEVALEVRSGSRVEMYDLRFLFVAVAAIPYRMSLRMSVLQASILYSTSATMPSSLAPSLVTLSATTGCDISNDGIQQQGSAVISIIQCNLSLSHAAEGSLLRLLEDLSPPLAAGGWTSCFANIALALVSSNVTVASPIYNVVAATGVSVRIATTSVTVRECLISFSGSGFLAKVLSNVNAEARNVDVWVSSSSITAHGVIASLLFVDSFSGSTVLVDVTAHCVDGTAVTFVGGEGYLVIAMSVNGTIVQRVNMSVWSSNVTVTGQLGALGYLHSAANVTQALGISVQCRDAILCMAGEGYVVFAASGVATMESNVSVTMVSTSMSVLGMRGGVVHAQTAGSCVAVDNFTVWLTASVLHFYQQGYLIFASSSLGVAKATMLTVTLHSSTVGVDGVIGSLVHVTAEQPGSGALLHDVTVAMLLGSAVAFALQGFGVVAFASTSSANLSNIHVSLHSSRIAVGGSLGALVYSEMQSVNVSDVAIVLSVGSVASFAERGCIFLSISVNATVATRLSCVVETGSTVTARGTVGALAILQNSEGVLFAADLVATLDGDSRFVCGSGEGYLVFLSSMRVASVRNVLAAVTTSSNMTVGGTVAALAYLWCTGTIAVHNISAVVATASTCHFMHQGGPFFVVSTDGTDARDVFVSVSSSSLIAGATTGGMCYLTSPHGTILLRNATVVVDNASDVRFPNEGYLIMASSPNVSAHSVKVFVRSSNVTVEKTPAALCTLYSTVGTVSFSAVRVDVRGGSIVRFFKEGYLVTVRQSTNATTSVPSVTSPGVTVNVSDSVLAVESLISISYSSSLVEIELEGVMVLNIGATNALVLVEGGQYPFVTANMRRCTVGLPFETTAVGALGPTNQGRTTFPPLRVVSAARSVGVSNVSLVVTCGLIGWHCFNVSNCYGDNNNNNNTSDVEPWTSAAAVAFLSGPLDGLPFRWRALRKLDVVGADRVAVTAERCAWGRGSHEFRATDSASSSVSSSLSPSRRSHSASPTALRSLTMTKDRSHSDFMSVSNTSDITVTVSPKVTQSISHALSVTATVLSTTTLSLVSSPTLSASMTHVARAYTTLSMIPSLTLIPIAVRRRTIVKGSGIPGPGALFVAVAASVVSSSVSTVVPGIQAIGQRSAVRRLCDAYNAADSTGAVAVPPLSDPASDPFGVTIGALGDELMYAGGSVVSSLFLALIYAAVVLVVAPMLRGPREWLRRVKTAPLAALRLPGSLYGPLALVLQPLTAAAVVLLASSSRSVGSVVFGLAVLVVATLPPLCAFLWRVRDHSNYCVISIRRGEWRNADKKIQVTGDRDSVSRTLRHITMTIFEGRYEYRPRARNHIDDASSVEYVERYGVVLSSYAAGRVWFIGVEIATTIATGVLSGVASGLDPSVVCSASVMDGFNWALAALCIVLLAAVVVLRPYSSHFENVQCGLSSLLAAVCLALQSLSPESPAIAAIAWVQSAIGFLPLLVEVISVAVGLRRPSHRLGLLWLPTDERDAEQLLPGSLDAARKSPFVTVCRRPVSHSLSDDTLKALIQSICKRSLSAR